jgi:signal transduction histidine kinase
MVGAVATVFLLAYLDLRREQARALEDFTTEQSALATACAATLKLRIEVGPKDGVPRLAVDGARLLAEVIPRGLPGEDANPPAMRWLLLDESGAWLTAVPRAVDAASTSRRADDRDLPADLRELLRRMATGAVDAILLGRADAAFLGLGRRSAVAGFAPVALSDGRRWSLAVVASARRVRDRARVGAWRLLAATLLAGLLVGLFGYVLDRQQRRELALAEALRLAEATAALRERSEKIVEAIPLGVIALDRDQRVTSVNPYLEGRDVAAGGALSSAFADAGDALAGLVLQARADRRPVERVDLRLGLGGEVRDVDALAIPLERPLPDIECFLVLNDRTEVRALERSLVRAEKLATIGTLAAGVAHEIGTPLGIISGRAEQVLAKIPDGDAGDPARKGLSSILSQVDKVSTTIRQLLDFARVRPVEATRVSPAQALSASMALLEHRFRQAKVSLEVSAPGTVPQIAGDPAQLEQVFVNLLINAVDACPAGGRVSARATQRDDRVLFEIADDGCGIAPEHLRSVLDPFFTTKKRGQGTGLGLTIAADIVKNHGGTLEIDSTVGRGTTVRFSLPAVPKEERP